MNFLLRNGQVYSVESRSFSKRDISIVDGRLAPLPARDSRIIDLDGAYVYPGLVDSHAHFLGTGLQEIVVNLEECSSLSNLEALLKQDREIVRARGWDQELLGFMPVRSLLDGITSRPAIIVRRCGHIATVNTEAIRRFDLEELHGLDGTDVELGIFKERALDELNSRAALTKEETDIALRKASERFLKHGVTSVHSDDLHGVELETLLDIMNKVDDIRVFEKIRVTSPEELSMIEESRTRETDFFKVISAKIYLDGSLGARTAALISPYSDSVDTSGILYMNSNELKRIVQKADIMGIQLCVHVIGDRALDVALDAFEGSLSRELLHRLIHVQIASARQIDTIAEIGMAASIQPIFSNSDRLIAPLRLGPTRIKDAYPFREMKKAGIKIAVSTDSPVESTATIPNFVAADEFFSRGDSIYMYSRAGHVLAKSDCQCSLLPGEVADLFVSKQNLLEEIRKKDYLSELTFVDGRIVHNVFTNREI